MLLFWFWLWFLTTTTTISAAPNFLIVIADDLGNYDTSVHNPNSPTPNLFNLSQSGLLLSRHYVYRYCSPTRRSLLTGRFPNHLTTVQPDGKNLCSDFLPLNATIISEKLALAQYDSYFIGKGHLGYQTEDHLPINRQFKSHVGFLAGSESYHHGGGTSDPTSGSHDLWENNQPGYDVVPTLNYATNYYTQRAVDILERTGTAVTSGSKGGSTETRPFFMYFSVQNVHTPYQLPPAWEQHHYPGMWNYTYANMLSVLDQATQNLTDALKRTKQWDNTLVLWTSDNGGIGLGNNYPLRGHKHDPWEGGTRVTAFLSGGYLPEHVRGTKTSSLVHVADWWPTMCSLAGIKDCTDRSMFAKDGGKVVHDIDGVNVWPMLMRTNLTQPRMLTPTTEVSLIDVSNSSRWWKLVTLAGQSVYYDEDQKETKGTDPCLEGRQPDPPQPGRTDALVSGCPVCNLTKPCLYDILQDPSERNNVAAEYPDVVSRLQPSVLKFQESYVTGRLTEVELERYVKIENPNVHWKGYLGPCYLRKSLNKDEF